MLTAVAGIPEPVQADVLVTHIEELHAHLLRQRFGHLVLVEAPIAPVLGRRADRHLHKDQLCTVFTAQLLHIQQVRFVGRNAVRELFLPVVVTGIVIVRIEHGLDDFVILLFHGHSVKGCHVSFALVEILQVHLHIIPLGQSVVCVIPEQGDNRAQDVFPIVLPVLQLRNLGHQRPFSRILLQGRLLTISSYLAALCISFSV